MCIGGQSDGKSSLLEVHRPSASPRPRLGASAPLSTRPCPPQRAPFSARQAFLGFRFNVRAVEIGTRRPLVIQMIHNSEAAEPRVSFWEAPVGGSAEPSASGRGFESVPVEGAAEEIQRRTQVHAVPAPPPRTAPPTAAARRAPP